MKTAHDTSTEDHKRILQEKDHKYYLAHRDEILAQRKERYANDEEFRRQRLEYRREYYLKTKFKGLIKDGTT